MKKRRRATKEDEFEVHVGPLKFRGAGHGHLGECLLWKSRAGSVEVASSPDGKCFWIALAVEGFELGRFETRHEAMLAVLGWWVKRRKERR